MPHFPHGAPILSPDGKAFFAYESAKGVWVGRIGKPEGTRRFELRSAFDDFLDDTAPFVWASDSRAIFGVKQERTRPNGFGEGPLSPYLFALNGSAMRLPELTSVAGPLDELYWADGGGTALAVFGTKGEYYRPPQSQPRPAVAIVDARRGKVLQSIEIAELPGATGRAAILGADVRVDGRGRADALIVLSLDHWVHWRQGEAPRLVPIGVKPWLTPFALTPDGGGVLVMRNLSATGVICEFNANCPLPTPASGAIAELHDLRTGKLIWSLDGTAKTFSRTSRPAISPDGRYSLVPMPYGDGGATTALVAMASGRILQMIPNPSTGECAVGFSPDGREAWISGLGTVMRYRIGR